MRKSTAMIERLTPHGSPAPRGPYSPAVRAGDFVFVSGQLPIDAASNKIASASVAEQTRQTIENLQTVLSAAGAGLADIVKCSVFLADIRDFAAMNEVYAEFFGEAKPARSTVQAVLPSSEARGEIDCIAYAPRGAAA